MHGIVCGGTTPAMEYACACLKKAGLPISPSGDQLLLDVPSFRPDGLLRSGEDLSPLLDRLAPEGRVLGGNLRHPALAPYRKTDLLLDPEYLAQNAYITAECVLDVLLPEYPGLIRGCAVGILGWGRIGKCLARLFKNLDAEVTVVARKETDRTLASSLGYRAVPFDGAGEFLKGCRILINTVPDSVLTGEDLAQCPKNCVKIELASRPALIGDDVIQAQGLPGRYRPEASGKLIADTMLRHMKQEGLL